MGTRWGSGEGSLPSVYHSAWPVHATVASCSNRRIHPENKSCKTKKINPLEWFKAVQKNTHVELHFIPQASNDLLTPPQPDSDGHQSHLPAIQLPPAHVMAHLGAHTQVYLLVFLPKESKFQLDERSPCSKGKRRTSWEIILLKNQGHTKDLFQTYLQSPHKS